MKEAYYFPHDANARTDAKILELRAEMGWEGYGLWWALVEQMREAGDYKLSNTLIGGLAMGLAIPKETLRAMLDLCISVGLLAIEGDCFYSPSLRRRLESLDAKRALRQQAGSKGGTIRAQREAAARAKGTHTQEEWQQVLAFCGNSCACCGSSNAIEKDHIKPIYQGGSDDIMNLQPLCKTCNTSKGPSSVDHRLRFVQAMLAPIPSKLQALLNPIDLTREDLTKPEESKEEPLSLRSEDAANAAGSEPRKKIEPASLQPESQPAAASHTRAPADVATRKARPHAYDPADIHPGLVLPFDTDEFRALWAGYRQYREEQLLPRFNGGMQEQEALRHLSNLATGDYDTATAIISQTIRNGWKNLFKLDEPRPQHLAQNGVAGYGQRPASAIHANPFGRAEPESLAIARAVVVGGSGEYPGFI